MTPTNGINPDFNLSQGSVIGQQLIIKNGKALANRITLRQRILGEANDQFKGQLAEWGLLIYLVQSQIYK